MPGFDGTGPRGMGPMTGGGRGFCAMPHRTSGYGPYENAMKPSYGPVGPAPDYHGHIYGVGRGGLPWGGGRGRAFGGGRGFRRWW